jgi:type VI secretion system protein ImpF
MAGASLLDRLSEQGGVRTSVSTLRESLRGDLEAMLNSRRHMLSWSTDLNELDRSLLAYGLDDFANESLASTDFRERFIEAIEWQIRTLEPRIGRFEVIILPNKDELDGTLRFRVTGTVSLGAEKQELSFDSHVDPVRGQLVMGS